MGDYMIFGQRDSVPVDRYRVNDPLFECVRIVLAQRGEVYSPAYIQGLSGAAFRLAGPCPCAPTCSAAMTAPELLDRLGHAVVAVTDPARVVESVTLEVSKGRAAIVFHAFSTAEWDVVAGFDTAKEQFRGRGSGTGEQLASAPWSRFATCGGICPVGGALLVHERRDKPDLRSLELDALEAAVRHAHSGRDRLLELPTRRPVPWRFRQGLACLDAWRREFGARPGKVPSAGDRYALSVYHDSHACAAPFLREIAQNHVDAREPLEQAAQRFERSAAALAELYDKVFEGWTGYKQPEPAKAERAAALLTTAGDAYREGMGCLLGALAQLDPDRAVRALQPARLRTTHNSLRIDDVPLLVGDEGHDCAFAGALEAAAKVTRHPVSYAEIMGLSGLAFRVRWSNDQTTARWCPSSIVGELPHERHALSTSLGWTLSGHDAAPTDRDLDALRLRIVDSLHAGLPVIAYPEGSTVALIVGYEEDGRTLLWHTYGRPEVLRLRLGRTGALQIYLGAWRQPPPLLACLRGALARALHNHEQRLADGGMPGREYWYGRAAYQAWSNDLVRTDLSAEAAAQRDALDRLATAALLDARRAAVAYLGEQMLVAQGPAVACLGQAKAAYENLLARLAIRADTSAEARLRLVQVAQLDEQAVAHLGQALMHLRPAPERQGIGRGLA